jgi:hypothetical protein
VAGVATPGIASMLPAYSYVGGRGTYT